MPPDSSAATAEVLAALQALIKKIEQRPRLVAALTEPRTSSDAFYSLLFGDVELLLDKTATLHKLLTDLLLEAKKIVPAGEPRESTPTISNAPATAQQMQEAAKVLIGWEMHPPAIAAVEALNELKRVASSRIWPQVEPSKMWSMIVVASAVSGIMCAAVLFTAFYFWNPFRHRLTESQRAEILFGRQLNSAVVRLPKQTQQSIDKIIESLPAAVREANNAEP